jgi:putative transposase/transposase-like zinc-binding protein
VQSTLRLLAACRTSALGGQVTRCQGCGQVEYRYHSCGDRHCPACGGLKRARWLERRRAEQLPVPYFHLVFTLPHELSALVLGNRKLLYDLLLSTSWQSLAQLGADPKHLGARLGAIAVLHTWGQQLEHHPHVHMIVPGGGPSLDGTRWIASRPNFLLSVKVLGKLFRGKFLAELRQASVSGQLAYAGSTASLVSPRDFNAFLSRLYAKDWNVYAKEPFRDPDTMFKYLTRYTHRVALSNDRLSGYDGERVTLSYKDYADGCRRKELRLSAKELLRRFCLHIVPKGLVRIRHYGILTNRDHGQRLAKCRELLASARPSTTPCTTPLSSPAPPSTPASPPRDTTPMSFQRPTSHPQDTAAPIQLDRHVPTTGAMAEPSAPALGPTPTPSPEPCPRCGGRAFEFLWFGQRPHGRDWQQILPWNTS